jgi:hypothetical protein
MSDLDEGLGHMEPQMPPPPAVEMEVNEVEDDPMEEEQEEEPLPPREAIPDEEVFKDAPSIKKVKRKCSEKQLAHLAKCREKARAKKEADKKFNEKQIAKQRKMLLAEERVKADQAEVAREKRNLAKAKRQVRQPRRAPSPEPVYEEEDFPYEEPPQQNTYRGQEHPQVFHKLTASEIRAIQHDAINDYEIIRKERKHKKKMDEEQRKIEHERRKVMGMMSGKPTPDHHDPWSSAFNF